MEHVESDEELAERAKLDREVFGIIYDRHVRRVYNYVYYRTGNAHDAEDLTARTFYQALANLQRYQVQGVPFSAWLFRIAHIVHREAFRAIEAGAADRAHIGMAFVHLHQAAAAPGRLRVMADQAEAFGFFGIGGGHPCVSM